MSDGNISKPTASPENPLDNENILNDIKYLSGKLIGSAEITFLQFTDILNKDNRLTYKRQTLLAQRERFFKGKEVKRGRGGSHEIRMSLVGFVGFLDFLTTQKKNPINLERLKKTILYCLEAGIAVGK